MGLPVTFQEKYGSLSIAEPVGAVVCLLMAAVDMAAGWQIERCAGTEIPGLPSRIL